MNKPAITQKKRAAILPDGAVKQLATRLNVTPSYVSRAIHHPEKTPSVKCQLIRSIANKIVAGIEVKADKIYSEMMEGAA